MKVRMLALALVLLAQVANASISGLTPAPPQLSTTIYPRHLAGTADGITWFSDERFTPHSVGWFDAAGTVHAFPVPCDKCATGEEITYIFALEPASDGTMWFLYAHAKSDGTHIASRVGQVTRDGTFTTWPVPTTDAFKFSINPTGRADITEGPDGNMWFTENDASKIAKITAGGVVTEYALANFAFPSMIVAGADGNLWFTETLRHKIGRITTAGVLTEFPLPANSYPFGLASGTDGTLWYTRLDGTKYGTMTTTGAVAEYSFGAGHSGIAGIVRGPDGAMWGPLYGSKELVRIEQPLSLATRVAANSEPVEYCRVDECLAADAAVSPEAAPLELTFTILPDSWRVYSTATDRILDSILGGRLDPHAGCPLDIGIVDEDTDAMAAGRMGFIRFEGIGGIPPYTLHATNIPPGMRMDDDTLWGVPSEAGIYDVLVDVRDALGCRAARHFAIDVQPARCAQLRVRWSAVYPLFDANQSVSFDVAAEGGIPPYEYELLDDTLGLSVDRTSGAVTGTLTPGCKTCYVLLPIRAEDSTGCYTVGEFQMVIRGDWERRYSVGH